MAILIFIYISCFIYNNIIFNSDNEEYFVLIEQCQSQWISKSDNILYYIFIPITSILFTIEWIKEDLK